MKPKEKVPSLELCKKLWAEGITSKLKTYFVWEDQGPIDGVVESWEIVKQLDVVWGERFPAPDLSEMGELLPVVPDYIQSFFIVKQRFIPCLGAKAEGYYFVWRGLKNKNMSNGEAVATKSLLGSQDKNEANVRAMILIALNKK